MELLVKKYNTSVLCLQETKINKNLNLKYFQNYNKPGTLDSMARAHGGVAIYVRNNIPQSKIILNTQLQAVAVGVTLHTSITFCSIYLPPNDNINLQALNNLYFQLPQPCIIVGDFNAHSYLWGSRNTTDSKGQLLENFINNNNLCLWNDDSPTYLHPATGSLTSIDLTMCSPAVFLDFS